MSEQGIEKNYYDLTTLISIKTVVYPGDARFECETVCDLGFGAGAHLCQLHLGNHTGTHIDFPSHVIKNGKNSSDFPIQHLIGAGLIVEVPEGFKSINREFVSALNILPGDIVFFKTANAQLPKQGEYVENYVYLEPEAAHALVEKQVKIVGIDYLSVDAYYADNLPVHYILLSHNILIVENLDLQNAPIGRCEIFILPLNIANIDGAPVRVVASI